MCRLALALTVSTLVALAAAPPTRAQDPAVTISVDAARDRRPISPEIYGVAFATAVELADLNVPLNRWGGNFTSRYNWQLNADNRANDWYFESIAYMSSTPGAEFDRFVRDSRDGGAEPMVTIPMMEWVAKLGPDRSKLPSFSIAKYGAQADRDWQWFPDAGNGIGTDGQPVTGNDPTDANVAADSVFQLGWMLHLTNRWGPAGAGGLRYYILDNEPSIWHVTHRDVHPVGATMAEVRDRIVDYASRVKDVDAAALVVAPEEWGWSGYLLSGYDQQYGSANGWNTLPDRASRGGQDYLPWLLDELARQHAATGRRLLDVFSVHYYPQGGEVSNDTSGEMQLRRNRSTRSLWDPAYVDETWIADTVMLVPRLRGWVAAHYPGTRTAITEYSWGAEDHINGATAQADVLGIFGREGLDLGARWTTPDPSTPTYKAIKMYRNYDGQGSTFGDVSVHAHAPDPDTLAVFAAQRSTDGGLTVMLVAKAALSGSTPATVHVAGAAVGGAAQVWRLGASNAISRLADLPVSASTLTLSLPPQSITLLVIPATGGNLPPTAGVAATPASGPAPLTVSFSDAGSADSDGAIVSYAWAFGDGATASGPAATHVYAAPGVYTATLTVTDDAGATASRAVSVTVSPALSLSRPRRLTARVSGSTVTLSWTDTSTGEGGFYVERAAAAPTLVWKRVASVGPNVRTFSQAPAERGIYVYRVQAFDPPRTAVSGYSNKVFVLAR